jgi:hypothetical protein
MFRRQSLRLVLLLTCLLFVGTVALAHVHPAEEYAAGGSPAAHCELCVQLDHAKGLPGTAAAVVVVALAADGPALPPAQPAPPVRTLSLPPVRGPPLQA